MKRKAHLGDVDPPEQIRPLDGRSGYRRRLAAPVGVDELWRAAAQISPSSGQRRWICCSAGEAPGGVRSQ